MDGHQFDQIVAALTAGATRRRVGGGLALVIAGLLRGAAPSQAGKKKNPKKKCHGDRPHKCGDHCCRADETCRNGKCLDHCHDGELNFGETSTDCGGSCRDVRKCAAGLACEVDADCASGHCQVIPSIDPDLKFCACRLDTDCTDSPRGHRCVESLCTGCAADFDCPPSRPFCVANADCPNNEPCTCAECRNGNGGDCDSRTVCRDGQCQACDTGFRACNGRCILFDQCCTNADCPMPGDNPIDTLCCNGFCDDFCG